MLEVDIKRIDFNADNFYKAHHLDLDSDVQCVFLFSTKDAKFSELFYNKILDAIIDRIHPKNVYKDFSSALESLNGFLVNWKHEQVNADSFSALIGIYNKNSFYFSTIGRAACYLFNAHKDIIEVTDKADFPKEFNFISSGDLGIGESLILSTSRILDVLSGDDIKDAFEFGGITQASDIIEGILLRENEGRNIANIILQHRAIEKETSYHEYFQKAQYFFLKMLDNNTVKTTLSYILHIKDKISLQEKRMQQIIITLGVLGVTLVLYFFLSGFLHFASQTGNTEQSKQELLQAQQFIVAASENMNDTDLFNYNIEQAKKIIENIGSKELFLGDVQKLENDISLLQKRINGIELFDVTGTSLVGKFPEDISPVGVLDLYGKKYVVGKTQVVGPILGDETANVKVFDKLTDGDEFVAATVMNNAGILMTKSGKVVQFLSSGTFTYQKVLNQDTWPKSPVLDVFGDNLYLLSDGQNQVEMCRKSGTDFQSAVSYLSDADAQSIGKIEDISVDGGIYILKADGSIVKLFKNPTYRLESLSLNNLPVNYDFTTKKNRADIIAGPSLNYVYMLLDERILIFKPNTTRYQDTKSLTYLGQIEGNNINIQSFYIENDGEIYLVDTQGLYKIKFEASEKDGVRIIN